MTKSTLRPLAAPTDAPEIRVGTLDSTRVAVTNGSIGFTGHAAMFNSRTAIGNPLTWGFYEQVADGAFSKTIGEADVRFLIDHDPSLVLARTKSGTLRLTEDAKGLAVDADLAPTSYGHDLATLLERGDVSQMSFGFQVMKDDWETVDVETSEGAVPAELRTIREVKLFDVSAVTFPAYEDTDAALRSVRQAVRYRHDPDPLHRRSRLELPPVQRDASTDQLQTILTALAAADAAIDPFCTALCLVDGALDAAQEALAAILGVPDPDEGDEGDNADEAMPARSALRKLHRSVIAWHREPAGSTREQHVEPAQATRSPLHVGLRRNALALRYGLPFTDESRKDPAA